MQNGYDEITQAEIDKANAQIKIGFGLFCGGLKQTFTIIFAIILIATTSLAVKSVLETIARNAI